MDFSNAKELLELCDSNKMSISEVMKQRECDESTSSKEEITEKMRRVLQIMRDSATMPQHTYEINGRPDRRRSKKTQ
ncbi:hypothetical protein HMPREF9099_00864 [Lachnospiraceae bacterium oral taxon 082 str. F0431]|nr:hypothetical protein HMPREF9099_00864 [Lachnospiraceae bacterium oral taxon 082 str. F0431]